MTIALLGNTATRLLSLGPLNLVIVVLYFAMVIGIGVYLKRFTRTGEDFFMAGRQMTAWVAGLSFISANLSSLETMGWSAMAYQYGMLGAHAYLIGAIPAILFLAVVMMPFYYISRTHSVPGYLQLRYGEGARSVAGISFTFLTVMVSGASMVAMRGDRITMAHGLEARSPLLDHELVEFLAKVPGDIKVQNNQPKHLMRKLAKDYLPPSILQRQKQGFMFPMAYWFRTSLFPFISSSLTNSYFVREGWFKKESVETLLTEYRSSRQDHHVRLWMLLNLEIWHRLYIEGVEQETLTERLQSLCLPQSPI